MSRRPSSTKRELPDPIFFVDADLNDSVFHDVLSAASVRFERHDQHFRPGTDDLEWLDKAGKLGWVVLSHNKNLRWVSGQTERLMEAGVAAIMLIGAPRPNPPGQRSVFTRELAENFVLTLPKIRRFLAKFEKPWIAKLYRPEPRQTRGTPMAGEIKMWLTLQEFLKAR